MKNILLFASFLTLFSCGSEDGTANNEANLDTSKTEETVQKTTFNASCLSENIEHFPNLIPNEELFKITGKTENGLTQRFVKANKGIYTYSWDGNTGRKTTLFNGMVVDVEDAVSIIITSTKSSVESFKMGYYPVEQSVSDDQSSNLKKEAELALKGQSSNERMNENVVELRKTGMSDEDIMKTYTGFSDVVEKTSVLKKIVPGVGEAAVWDTSTHELMVNADKMTFWIIVTLNDDDEKDLEIAKKITQAILDGCD